MEIKLSRLERFEIKCEIEELNQNFCHYLDHGMVGELVSLFTIDARYSHGRRISQGRAEIQALFAARAATEVRTSRHFQSGLRIALHGHERASAVSLCLTFAADSPPPVSPATPHLVADFIDEYILTSSGRWLIDKRHIERIFTATDNSGPLGLNKNTGDNLR